MEEFLEQVETFIKDSHKNLLLQSKRGNLSRKLSAEEAIGITIFKKFLLDELTEAKKMVNESK